MGSSTSRTACQAKALLARLSLSLPVALVTCSSPLLLATGAANADQSAKCALSEDIVIAVEDSFFPYAGLYQEELRGFAVDLVNAAFSAEGCSVTLNVMPYNRCVREVTQGRQLGCFNTTGSDENRRNYIFHQTPLFYGKVLIYSHPENTTEFHPDFFKNKTFSVVRGYTYTDAFDADETIMKVEVDSDLQTLALTAKGRTDYAVVYEKVAAFHISNSQNFISPPPVAIHELARLGLFVSFSKNTPERSQSVAALLDRGLNAIREDGTYHRIEATWDEWLQHGLKDGQPAPHWKSGQNAR